MHQQPVSPTARGDGGGGQPRGFASSLLSRWGFFKRGSDEGEATVAQVPGSDKAAATRLRLQQPHVRVHFKVGFLRWLMAVACCCTRLRQRVCMCLGQTSCSLLAGDCLPHLTKGRWLALIINKGPLGPVGPPLC